MRTHALLPKGGSIEPERIITAIEGKFSVGNAGVKPGLGEKQNVVGVGLAVNF